MVLVNTRSRFDMKLISMISVGQDLTGGNAPSSLHPQIHNIPQISRSNLVVGYESLFISLSGGCISKTVFCIDHFLLITVLTGNISILVFDHSNHEFHLLNIGDSYLSNFARINKNCSFSIKTFNSSFQLVYYSRSISESASQYFIGGLNLFSIWQDPHSLAIPHSKYYCHSNHPGVIKYDSDIFTVGRSDISFLKKSAYQSPLKRSRICFHSDSSSKLQVMLIYMLQDSKILPALHSDKSESLTILFGSAIYKTFSYQQDNLIVEQAILGNFHTSNPSFVNTPQFVIHDIALSSSELLFLEVTTGPFDKTATIEFDF